MTSKTEIGLFVFVGAIFLVVGCLIGVLAGQASEASRWHRKAVQHGVAQYDTQTGKWHWTVGEDAETPRKED